MSRSRKQIIEEACNICFIAAQAKDSFINIMDSRMHLSVYLEEDYEDIMDATVQLWNYAYEPKHNFKFYFEKIIIYIFKKLKIIG